MSVLGPLDLLVGKLARADEEDLEDIRFLIAHESLTPQEIREALERAVVPPILADAFAASRPKIERLLGDMSH